MTDQTKQFDLNMLAQALSVIHYVVLNDQLICLSGLQHAEVNTDDSLTLTLISGLEISLDAEEHQLLAQILSRALDQAKAMAARQAAKELGLVQVPGQMH